MANRTTVLIAALAFVLTTSQSLSAQEGEEFDPRAVIKQINKDFETILQSMSGLTGTSSAEEQRRVVEQIDELIDSMQKSQGDVVNRIEELIKNMKQSQSSSQSSSNQQRQNKNKNQKQRGNQQRRDRNQGPQNKERAGQPKNQPRGENEPRDSSEESGTPEQSRRGRKPPKSDEELYRQILEQGQWGDLPPEARQKLINTNFRDWFPDYEREIGLYLKSLSRKR